MSYEEIEMQDLGAIREQNRDIQKYEIGDTFNTWSYSGWDNEHNWKIRFNNSKIIDVMRKNDRYEYLLDGDITWGPEGTENKYWRETRWVDQDILEKYATIKSKGGKRLKRRTTKRRKGKKDRKSRRRKSRK
uniref:Uncharacterized protein n=1 Tax=viral metagenome TaxID=1070528 RepID=A0A6C0BB60_9ZZZZ